MAEAVVSFVLERLGDLLIEETKFLHGVGGQVQQIHDELRWMQAFLKDADARQHEEQRIREWVSDVRTLAYDAGDVLESFLLRVESKRRGGIKNILKRYICILNECVALHKAGSEMQGIKAKISELNTHKETCGIISFPEGSGVATDRQSQLRRSYSHVGQDDFVGLEGDVENLVMQLVSDRNSDENYYQVVSICGMGGLGKTTLAQKIYNHLEVKRHFAAFAWVCISQQWQTKEVLQKVLIKLLPERRDEHVKLEEEELIRELFNIQQDKHCLVVLDDIWSKDAWDRLKPAFHIGKRNSKLLLTSRNTEVATHVDPEGWLYQPRFLKENECWELLKKKAFTRRDRRDLEDVEKMEKLGKEMVRHCGGLPFAVIALGGVLITKQRLREWEKVHQSIKSYIRSGDRDNQGEVLEILALSYNELPSHLKLCFLYLGKFPKDSEIEVERLYLMWIAESMVQSEHRREGETMMDVAERYLVELVQRHMVQVSVQKDDPKLRRFRSCRLHDVVRELCLFKAKEEDFFHVVDFRHDENDHEGAKSLSSLTNRTRRLSIYLGVDTYVPPRRVVAQRLSTISFFLKDKVPISRISRTVESILSHSIQVRVLDLGGLIFSKLPEAIGNLIYLKYLGLRYTVFHELPSTIGNIVELQTLDLWDDNTQYASILVPDVLCKLKKLKHLYLRRLVSSDQQKKLQLNGMSELEILENFDPKSFTFTVEHLLSLTQLRKLGAKVSTKSDLEKMTTYLESDSSNQLKHFTLSIKKCDLYSEDGQDLLTKVFMFGKLHEFSLNGGRTGKLPKYKENFSPCLIKLTLESCELKDDPIPMLEKLPNLRSLFLKWNPFIVEEIVCSGTGFPQLRILQLWRIRNLQNWRVEKGAMPKLSSLDICSCPNLKMIPDGLQFVTTLQQLGIIWMPQAFTNRVLEDGEDFHKVEHVLPIKIIHYDGKEDAVHKKADPVAKKTTKVESMVKQQAAPNVGVVIREPTSPGGSGTTTCRNTQQEIVRNGKAPMIEASSESSEDDE